MTYEEAVARCKQLGSEHEDKETHSWLARQAADGDWTVVKVPRLPGQVNPLTATVEAKPRPPQPDDPRELHTKLRPGY